MVEAKASLPLMRDNEDKFQPPYPSKARNEVEEMKDLSKEIGMKIRFEEPLPQGFALRLNGQNYRTTRIVDYTTKLGAVIDMQEWSSMCWDCGKPFYVLSHPLGGPESRRCKDCAKPGVKTRKKTAAERIA